MRKPPAPARLEKYGNRLLGEIRQAVESSQLSLDRLPDWVQTAKLIAGTVSDTALLIVEDSPDRDVFEPAGQFVSDMGMLFPGMVTSGQAGAGHDLKAGSGCLGVIFDIRQGGNAIFTVPSDMGFFNAHFGFRHWMWTFVGLTFQISRGDDPPQIVGMRHVPLMVQIHRADIELDYLPTGSIDYVMTYLQAFHEGPAGDRQAERTERLRHFKVTKERSVIVLGKDTGDDLAELIAVRDYLRSKGFEGELIKGLAEIPTMSNAQKVQMWTSASRFAVMIDREPSGHIGEYVFLKQQQTITAFLRPRGKGSTYMIGDDEVELRFIKHFEFVDSPLEVMEEVIVWAEGMSAERQETYAKAYPWRAARPRSSPS